MIDFRIALNGLSLYDIGETISWGEAYAYIEYLRFTQGTLLHMKESDWDYPLSLEASLQMDANEIAANANRGKGDKYQKLYPRPNDKKPQVAAGTPVSFEEAQELYGL